MTSPHRFEPRLSQPPEDDLSPAQKLARQRIAEGPRGVMVGPFEPLLQSPELMTRVQHLGEFLRFESSIPNDLLEVLILVVAREWNQEFEWAYHVPIALKAGVAPGVIDQIHDGECPTGLDDDYVLVWDAATELMRTHQLGDQTYSRVLAHLGAEGLVEFISAIGYYVLLAMVMNTAQTPPPTGGRPLRPLARTQQASEVLAPWHDTDHGQSGELG